MRVIVTFDGQSPAAQYSDAAFIREMQSRTQAQITYLAPVGGATHVYSVQPNPGQSIKQVLQRLGNMLIVRNAEVDQKMKVQ